MRYFSILCAVAALSLCSSCRMLKPYDGDVPYADEANPLKYKEQP